LPIKVIVLGQAEDFHRAGGVGQRWQVAVFADAVDGRLAVLEDETQARERLILLELLLYSKWIGVELFYGIKSCSI
jgi:hypothetical protein